MSEDNRTTRTTLSIGGESKDIQKSFDEAKKAAEGFVETVKKVEETTSAASAQTAESVKKIGRAAKETDEAWASKSVERWAKSNIDSLKGVQGAVASLQQAVSAMKLGDTGLADKMIEITQQKYAGLNSVVMNLSQTLTAETKVQAEATKAILANINALADQEIAARKVANAVKQMNEFMSAKQSAQANVDQYDKIGAALRKISADRDKLNADFHKNLVTFDQYKIAMEGLAKAEEDALGVTQKRKQAELDKAKAMEETKRKEQELAKAIEAEAAAAAKAKTAAQSRIDEYDRLGARMRKLKADEEQLRLEHQKGLTSTEQYKAAIAALNAEMKRTPSLHNQYRDALILQSVAANTVQSLVAGQSAMSVIMVQSSQLLGVLGQIPTKLMLVGAGFTLLTATTLQSSYSIAKAGDAWNYTQARVANFTDSTQSAVEVMHMAYTEAQKLGTSVQDVAKAFARYKIVTKDLGIDDRTVMNMVTTIQKFAMASGATVQEAHATAIQLSQALSSGKLHGDELRSVLENSSLFAKALAQELGVSVGTLREMGKEGTLTSTVILKAMVNMKEKADKLFDGLPVNFERAWTQVGNAFNMILVAIDKRLQQSLWWKLLASDLKSAFEGIASSIAPPETVEQLKEELARIETRIKNLQELQKTGGQEQTVIAAQLRSANEEWVKTWNKKVKAEQDLTDAAEAGSKRRIESAQEEIDKAREALDVADKRVKAEREMKAKMAQIGEKKTLAGQTGAVYTDAQYLADAERIYAEYLTKIAELDEKARDKKADFYKQDWIELERQIDHWKKEYEQREEGVKAIELYILKLQTEKEQSEMSARERAIHVDIMKAEELARKKNLPLIGEETRLTEDQIKKIREASGARYDNMEAAKKAEEAAKRAAREFEKDLDRVVEYGASRITDGLFDAMRKGWGEVLTGMITDFLKTLTYMAVQALLKPIIIPIMEVVVDAATGTATGGSTTTASGSGSTSTAITGTALSKAADYLLGDVFQNAGQSFAESSVGNLMGLSTSYDVSGITGVAGDTMYASTLTSGVESAIGAGLTMVGSMLGKFGADMLMSWDSYEEQMGATISSTVGSIAGTIIGGPVGAAIGSFLGDIIGGLFGGLFEEEPSNKAQWGSYDVATGEVYDRGGQEGDKFSQAMSDATDATLEYVDSLITGLEDILGVSSSLSALKVGFGERDGFEFEAWDAAGNSLGLQNFETGDINAFITALSNVIVDSLGEIPEDVQYVLDNMNWERSVEEILADVDFAMNYTKIFDLVKDESSEAENKVRDLFDLLSTTVEKAVELGLSTNEVTEDFQTILDSMFDAGTAMGALESSMINIVDSMAATIDELAALEGYMGYDLTQFYAEGYQKILDVFSTSTLPDKTSYQVLYEDINAALAYVVDNFEALGLTTEHLAQVYTQATAAMEYVVEAAEANVQSRINESTGQGYLNEVTSIATQYAIDWNSLGSVGGNQLLAVNAAVYSLGELFATLTEEERTQAIAYLNTLYPELTPLVEEYTATVIAETEAMEAQTKALQGYEEARQDYLDALSAELELVDKQITAKEEEAAQYQQTIDKMGQFADQFAELRDQLKIGNLSNLSPEQKYLEAKKQYEEIAAAALTGDDEALGKLAQAAQEFLTASQGYYASSAGYTTDYDAVMLALEQAEDYAKDQVDYAQAQLDVLNEELTLLRSEAESLRLLIDEVQNNGEITKTVEVALRDFQEAMLNLLAEEPSTFTDWMDQYLTSVGFSGSSQQYVETASDSDLQKLFSAAQGFDPTIQGMIELASRILGYSGEFGKGGANSYLTSNNLTDKYYRLYDELMGYGQAPMFASGGYLPEGEVGIAGEAGKELIFGPAYIANPEITALMMGRASIGSTVSMGGVEGRLDRICGLLERLLGVTAMSGDRTIQRLDMLITSAEEQVAQQGLNRTKQ